MRRAWFAIAAGALLANCAAPQALSPSSADAYANFLVGRMADLRQDHAAASDRLYRALREDPADPQLAEAALVASLAIGDVDRARDVARIADANDLNTGYAQIVKAVDALADGRVRRARAALNNMEGGSAEQLTGRLLSVWVSVAAGGGERAADDLRLITAPRPYDTLLAYTRAMTLHAAERDAGAMLAYDEANRGGFWIPPAAEHYADILARSGDPDGAAAFLREREGRFGSPAQLAAADRIANGASAAPELTAARGAAVSLYGLGLIMLEESDTAHGLATMHLALMLDPSLDAARIAIADAQLDLNHGQEARQSLSQVGPDSDYAESAGLLHAMIALREGGEDEAVALARQAVEDGGGARAQRALADFYRALDRFAEAEPIYSELIAADPNDNDWRLHFARAITRERQSRWSEAEVDLLRALELAPNQPDVLNYLGYTWVDRGERLDEALAMIERAVQARPTSGAIIDSLGWAYFRMGDFERALQYLERAVALSPADPILNDHLGDAYWRMNRRIEARFQWRRALSLDPDESERANIERKLAEGLAPVVDTRSATR